MKPNNVWGEEKKQEKKGKNVEWVEKKTTKLRKGNILYVGEKKGVKNGEKKREKV